MPINSTAELIQTLRQCQLLDGKQLAQVKSWPNGTDMRALAKEMVRRGWLTPYQVNQLLQGQGSGLRIGSYILLNKLGKGAMGEVYKARHQRVGRVVALKVIRKERSNNRQALRRFDREIRLSAQLDHPNVVSAYDAEQAGDTQLLAMEYVEGTDLDRIVRKKGPLPVKQACEYIRQAALGLQHAYQLGLVHRDIKPSNLIVTSDRTTVKILDMGLARPQLPTPKATMANLTVAGAIVGTPDYIAPEQARNSRTADIRCDLYSLGGTFYFLLTGRVPFPEGGLPEKLLQHLTNDPVPVDQVRPEVPKTVVAIVKKMLAKRPEDRYQTPEELAEVLATISGSDGNPKRRRSRKTGIKPSGRKLAGLRRQFVSAVGFLMVLLLLGVVGYMVWGGWLGLNTPSSHSTVAEKPTTTGQSTQLKKPSSTEPMPKVDPTGMWHWTVSYGDRSFKRRLYLRMEDGMLSGHLIRFDHKVPIKETSYENGKLVFTVSYTRQGRRITAKYEGVVSRDRISGKRIWMERKESRSTDWEASRSVNEE